MSPEGPPAGHKNDPDNRIDEAFGYFAERVTAYIGGIDEDDPESAEADSQEEVASRAERLRITLCDLLKLVSITLETGDSWSRGRFGCRPTSARSAWPPPCGRSAASAGIPVKGH